MNGAPARPARRFGPRLDGRDAAFRLYAPDARRVELLVEGMIPLPMTRDAEGFFAVEVAGLAPGRRYRFRADGLAVPDPASRMQEHDPDGWSVLIADPPPRLGNAIRPWHEAIIAEVHVGTATPEGTFAALIDRLDHYAGAGFTAIELMPVADFQGQRNWGYDGVLLYAPDRAYGTADELRALVDAAHARGLGVLLDVVYNHFGPSGNYLPAYATSFFREDVPTPWGPAIDLENETVRGFFTENAAYWLGDFGFDGLRFDAVHALATKGAETFLAEIAHACRAVRPDAWLVLENHDNIAEWLLRDQKLYTAQWNDDWHHAFHVLATGESGGYYAPYADDAAAAAARALAEGFVFQGEPYPDAGGHPRGTPSAGLPPDAFVSFAQNHDHIGNRPLGDRLAGTVTPERLALLRFVLMLSPQIPLLFQGEEALLPTPFPFFCDFEGALAEAVRKGRRAEFADFFRHHDEGSFPDPLDEATFRSARLTEELYAAPEARAALAAFRTLAGQRAGIVWPLAAGRFLRASSVRDGSVLVTSWCYEAGTLVMALNPSGEAAATLAPALDAPAASVGEVVIADGRLSLSPFAAALWHLPAGGSA
ncbi:malto-oligosyltrehalose trehalohydrolase [Ancylobacter oerskovii]|uniref:Malto-oligosyltrehalose trehalohydrolase n=1 Tax=Ancylobacter oerskovii TaxID=459519 RepID=A0ABW4YZL1_9HYPH|nr:malto-oligosyltrehalose trehalohydrolase [Ancylobacter oerskovii]MBS7543907.1 malto-oligosyltrehalose trehalohydrolase [Ancylobacter oerskovii]